MNLNASDMSGLSEDQKKAVLESLFIAIGVDRQVDPSEGKQFEIEVRKIPWDMDKDTLSATVVAARDRVNDTRDRDGWLGWIDEIATRLPSEIRVKVIATMARLAFVNGLKDRERKILNAFIQAFELPEATVRELRKEFGVESA